MKDKYDNNTIDMFSFGQDAAKTICKDLSEVDKDITLDNILDEVDNNWRGYMHEDIGVVDYE